MKPTLNPRSRARAPRIAVLLASVVVLARAADPDPQPAAPSGDPRLAEGRRLVQRTFGVLSSNLLEAIRVGGTTNALEFCSVHATPLTAASGTNAGVAIRRLTHRPRNPANRAGSEDLAVLGEFRKALAPGKAPPATLRTNLDGSATFHAPIVLNNPLCLACHGTPGKEVQPATLEVLRRLYPRDEATGFALGDLRGLWRIDFPPPKP